MNDLPQPVTVTEMYLAAVLAELQAIHKLLSPNKGILQAEPPLQPANMVNLFEPSRTERDGKRKARSK